MFVFNVCLVTCWLCVQVVFEAAAPVGNTDALSTKEEMLFPHLVSLLHKPHTTSLAQSRIALRVPHEAVPLCTAMPWHVALQCTVLVGHHYGMHTSCWALI
jgi:hypothetical protein